MRRNIIIVGIVILLLLLCIGVYFLFFASTPTSQTGGPTGSGNLPNAGNQTFTTSSVGLGGTGATTTTNPTPAIGQALTMVASGPILDYFVNTTGVITAIEPNGTIIQISNGQVSTLNTLQIQNISNASFSYDGKKILVSFGDPATPQTSIFDIASSAWISLSANLQSPTWSPSDYRIAYASFGLNGTETFSIIDTSKAKPTPAVVQKLYAQDLAVAWPTKNELVFYTKPSASVLGSILSFDLQKKTLTSMISEENGLTAAWNTTTSTASSSPAGLMFLTNNFGTNGSLALIGWSGSTMQNLSFDTLPSKCAFAMTGASSTQYLFCGVPRDQNGFSSAHLPDDYNQMALFTSDDLNRVNLQSGIIDTVFDSTSDNIDISDIKFFNNALFFVNRYDQKLYSIQLSAGA